MKKLLVVLSLNILAICFGLAHAGSTPWGPGVGSWSSTSCSYGQAYGQCRTAAAYGSPSAQAYVNQVIQNNPNPNKTTFYNYDPTTAARLAAQRVANTPLPSCQSLYGNAMPPNGNLIGSIASYRNQLMSVNAGKTCSM